jgi:hypothetical protein
MDAEENYQIHEIAAYDHNVTRILGTLAYGKIVV